MKRIILLNTHLGSNSNIFCYNLDKNKHLQWVDKIDVFDHPIKMDLPPHRYSETVGLYLYEILYNYQITHKGLNKTCEFIYLLREPRFALKGIAINPQTAVDYYIFRLRRIYETAKTTDGAIFLTWQDVTNGKAEEVLKKRLGITWRPINVTNEVCNIPTTLLEKAERAYELCLYRINSKTKVSRC
jgi:hypothetical protein